jgi:acetyl-CoA C-acetyltransferase
MDSSAMPCNDNTPVIIGAAQRTWREPDFDRTPAEALYEVCAAATDDAGGEKIRSAIDALVSVRFIADTTPAAGALFPRNPCKDVAERLGIKNPELYLGAIGGNTPQYLVNRMVEKVCSGEHAVALLTGAEFMASFFSALKGVGDISKWAGEPTDEPPTLGEERDGLNEQEKLHGLYEPINTYPLFEMSLAHHMQLGRSEHDNLIAEISARMSAVAAGNEYAWRQEAQSAETIGTVAPKNRYIGYPYTRSMNAVLEVDMGAAVIITTVGKARELGVPEEQWIYYRGGVDVNDIWYPSERENFYSSPAIKLGWENLSQSAGVGLEDLSHFDIYSCFPSAVQISCNAIGLSPLDERNVTVTGGLPYFGGPGNNYSLHAIAQMVSDLRSNSGTGLVTANGLYLTKHSLGLYSSEAPTAAPLPLASGPLQEQIESGPRVTPAAQPEGSASVETYTVAFDREGPKKGIVVARNAQGERIIANSSSDEDTLKAMVDKNPIGQQGNITTREGINIFEF